MVETTESRDAEVARIAEILHDLDGTQHYTTHEQGYDGDDIEGVTCATGIEGHMEDAADAYHAGLRSTSRDSEVLGFEHRTMVGASRGNEAGGRFVGPGLYPKPSRDSEVREALRDAGAYVASLGGDESAIVAAEIAAILDRSSEAAPLDCDFCGKTVPDADYDEHRRSHHFHPASEAAPVVGLSETALATALCSTFDFTHHDHEAFLQPDHCEVGLIDARDLIARLTQTRTLGEKGAS